VVFVHRVRYRADAKIGRVPRDKCAQAGVPVPLKAKEPADAGATREKTTAIQRRQRFLHVKTRRIWLLVAQAGMPVLLKSKSQKRRPEASGTKSEKTKAMVRRGGLLFLDRL